jgi:hypothetical protein
MKAAEAIKKHQTQEEPMLLVCSLVAESKILPC